MYVQCSRLLRILSPHSFSVYLATCWQKYPISFTANFTEKVSACAFSVYQALSLPLKGPGDEATRLPASVYSKYMYLQINRLFLHEKALTVAQKYKKLVELALNKNLGLWLSIENRLHYIN